MVAVLPRHFVPRARTDRRQPDWPPADAAASAPFPAYALPHLLNRDSGGHPFSDVLIIGAGSGNDVSRALVWGAERVDAVEIDPVIQRIGKQRPSRSSVRRSSRHRSPERRPQLPQSPRKQYDLIIYALVDSLVLHSSYSNIRLESYLFTKQAMDDVRRALKPGGMFVMYNSFAKGGSCCASELGAGRLRRGRAGTQPPEPRHPRADDNLSGAFTVFIAGANERIRTPSPHTELAPR